MQATLALLTLLPPVSAKISDASTGTVILPAAFLQILERRRLDCRVLIVKGPAA